MARRHDAADPRLAAMMNGKTTPFDAKRMIYGGFTPLVMLCAARLVAAPPVVERWGAVAKAIIPSAALGAFLAAALFLPAGHVRWPTAWAFLMFYAIYSVAGSLLVDPGLIAERTRSQPDSRPLDLLLAGTAFLLTLPVTVVVCGFDARYGWSPTIPAAVQAAALGVFAAGYCMALWAARHNRFFSTVVRIQRERGHHVVDTGPYALVRHPGYAGSIPAHVALPIALGSFWGLVPTVAGIAFLVARTAFEDRVLAEELPGYRDYVRRVRWRLVPGIW